MDDARPNCKCHGEPMRSAGKRGWRCDIRARAYMKAYREAHRAEIAESHRAWKSAHQAEVRENQRAWSKANADKKAASFQRYYAKNRDKRVESSKKFYEAHREEKLSYARERYWAMTGVEYNRALLMARRRKALKRMAKRNAEREAS